MVDDLRVREWCEIRAAAVLATCAYEADGAGDDGADEELVVESCWAAGLVGVDADVLLFETFAVVVGALTGFPGGVLGLGVVPGGV